MYEKKEKYHVCSIRSSFRTLNPFSSMRMVMEGWEFELVRISDKETKYVFFYEFEKEYLEEYVTAFRSRSEMLI